MHTRIHENLSAWRDNHRIENSINVINHAKNPVLPEKNVMVVMEEIHKIRWNLILFPLIINNDDIDNTIKPATRNT